MRADASKIADIFSNNSKLRIPYYQRNYVWSNEGDSRNLTEFAKSMENTMKSPKNYNLGALEFSEIPMTPEEEENSLDGKFSVVDGQQRLTTMAIYMKVAHLLAGKNDDFNKQFFLDDAPNEPVLCNCLEDRPAFNAVMRLDAPTEDVEGYSGKIIDAYKFFLKRLKDFRDKENGDINLLLKNINKKVRFVTIILTKEDDEQQSFHSLNCMGRDLTTDEQLKNFLYEEKDRDEYYSTWHEMFDTKEAQDYWETDAAMVKASKGARIIDHVLFAVARVLISQFRGVIPNDDMKWYQKEANVFQTYVDLVERFGMTKLAVAKEILTYSQLFKTHLDKSVLNERIPMNAGIKRISCFINATSSFAVMPYVLYVLRNSTDPGERDRLFNYLETYLMRRYVCREKTNMYGELFAEQLVGKKVLTYEALKAHIEGKDDDVSLAMPSNEKITIAVTDKTIEASVASVIFYMFETRLASAEDGIKGGFNQYAAEALMPKYSVSNAMSWPVNADPQKEEKRRKTARTLGNYFLLNLGESDNSEINAAIIKRAKNMAFNMKQNELKPMTLGVRSSYPMLVSLTCWDEIQIGARGKGYSKTFGEKIWMV